MIDPIGQVWTPFAQRARRCLQLLRRARSRDAGAVADDTVLRGVAAAGVLYSYPFVAHTASASHVFAPTAQIIVRQNTADQQRLPDEDAKSLVFDDTLLFDIDKFSGYDRFETGTRANVGMQYTLQANNGVYARFVFGQSFHLAGENPYVDPGLDPTGKFYYSPTSGLETNRSDYVAGLYLSPFKGLSLITQARFDERDWSLRRNDTILQGSLWPAVGLGGLLLHAFRSCDRPDRQSAGHHGQPRPAAHQPLERVGIDALRHRCQAAHPGHPPAQVRRRMLRADGELHRDLRPERHASASSPIAP